MRDVESNQLHYANPKIEERSTQGVCFCCGKTITVDVRSAKVPQICFDCGLSRALTEHRRGFRY